jgi:hypothetical protein
MAGIDRPRVGYRLVRPNLVTLAAARLEVHGAWVDGSGPEALAAWLRLVPSRLATSTHKTSR